MSAPSEAPDADSRRLQQRHIRGSTLLVLGRVLSLLLSMATSVVLVRVLSKADYGAFAYALVLAAGARVLLSLGQGRLLSRFMASYQEKRDYPRMFGALLLTVGTIAVTSVVCIGAVYLFTGALVGSAVRGQQAEHLLLILVFLSPLQALDQVFVSLFAVFSKPTAIFFRKFLMAPGLQLVVVLLLALTGASVTFLAVGYVIASAAGIALYVVLFIGAMREQGMWQELRRSRVIIPYREVFEFSFPLITSELALLSFTMGGVMVLGMSHGAIEVANYRAVFNPARLNTAVTASFVTLFLPVIARFHTRGDTNGLRNSYWHTAAFVAVATFPIFALTGPLAPATTVALFGMRYSSSSTVLAVLAVGYYVNVMLGFNAYTVQVCGRIRYLVGVNVVVTILNIGICLALAAPYGAVGVAVANCVALITQNVLNQWALRGAIGTRFVDREAWVCYSIIVAGAAVLWVFRLLVSPGIVLSLAAAVVVSAAVLAGSRRALQLGETFPELSRIPLFGRLIS